MARNFPNDHAAAIAAKTNVAGNVVFTAPTNADGTLSIQRNGITLYKKILPARGFSPTDHSDGSQVVVFDATGAVAVGDFQALLDTLK